MAFALRSQELITELYFHVSDKNLEHKNIYLVYSQLLTFRREFFSIPFVIVGKNILNYEHDQVSCTEVDRRAVISSRDGATITHSSNTKWRLFKKNNVTELGLWFT